MPYRVRVVVCLFTLTVPAFAGTIIHVPADQPTIQAGINAAVNGDIVLVAPGTYSESINFNGKAITVESSNGASVTTLAIPSASVGVTFNHSEMNSSVLKGFTLQGGMNTAGIFVASSSPRILSNTIMGNHSCDGAGIAVSWSSPIIEGNKITGNFHDMCSGGAGGGGIAVTGQGSTQIIGNILSGNDGGNGFSGGAISLWAAGSPYIANNIIMNNTGSNGGAIGIAACCSDAVIVQNLIIGNSAGGDGGGIYSFGNSGAPSIVNNTFRENQAASGIGSALYTNSSPGNPTKIYNNIIFGVSGQTALYCDNFNTSTLPDVYANDVYAPSGTRYAGVCTDQTGTNGNISSDPNFVSSSNLRLKGGSLAIDAGNNAAPHLPTKDFAGNPRVLNGNGGSSPIVDMGAYEFVPVALTPRSLSFGLQAIGSTSTKTVNLTNAQNKVLKISSYSVPTGYSVSGCGTSVPAFASCKLAVTFHPLTTGTFKGLLAIKDDTGTSPQRVSLVGSAQ